MRQRARAIALGVAALALADAVRAEWSWERRPVLKAGEEVRIEFRGRLMGTSPWWGSPARDGLRGWGWDSARLSIDGSAGEHAEFQVEYDFSREKRPWRDLWVEFRLHESWRVKAGRFKMPFSRDELTSVAETDFIRRSLLANLIAPARDQGVGLRGQILGKRLVVETGGFAGDGDNARGGGATGALRISSRVLKGKRLGSLEMAGAATIGKNPPGLNSLRGDTHLDEVFFPRFYVEGWRRRAGAEVEWSRSRLRVRYEFATAGEERKGQGLFGDDLPQLVSTAWYVSGVYRITRSATKKSEAVQVTRGLEAGARWERAGFGGGASRGTPSINPRAPRIAECRDSAWTLGLNWSPQTHLRAQFNLTRESLSRPALSGHALRQGMWVAGVRLQLVF